MFGRRKMNAVFAESGKQFYVQAGDTVRLDYREANPGDTVEFDRVLLVTDGNGGVAVGRPYVAGAKVVAKVIGDVRGQKIHVGFYKRRKNFRKHKGHRQTYTEVKVDSITY
jgi:large subunit ribosomal protein L21